MTWCARPNVSARSTIRVLTLGMSSPDSIMVVHTRTSLLPSAKSAMTLSSVSSGIWPRPTVTVASGTMSRIFSAVASILRTRL